MSTFQWKQALASFDDRRDIVIPGTESEVIKFCVEHFVYIAQKAVEMRGVFAVALSGGKTPHAIYQALASPAYQMSVDWAKVLLFWSDERCVPPDHPESNYLMAMEAGLSSLQIPAKNIFRMPADQPDLEQAAHDYDKLIQQHVPEGAFDLLMLGMGEDGHTASLFPKTHGLHVDEGRLAIVNFIPQKEIWRMTLTFECINQSRHPVIYVLGKNKASMVKRVLMSAYDPDLLPIQRVGTRLHKALWVVDNEAASDLVRSQSD